MNDLQSQIDALSAKLDQMTKSPDITRDNETALRERLGLANGSQAFPIGSIFMSTVSTNPLSLLGYGTWVAFGTGQVPVGFSSGDSDFGTLLATGGVKTHALTTSEMPSHQHAGSYAGTVFNTNGANNQNGVTAGSTAVGITPGLVPEGGGGAHTNLQPFIVVQMWKRTA